MLKGSSCPYNNFPGLFVDISVIPRQHSCRNKNCSTAYSTVHQSPISLRRAVAGPGELRRVLQPRRVHHAEVVLPQPLDLIPKMLIGQRPSFVYMSRHDVIIESACLWLEDVNSIQFNPMPVPRPSSPSQTAPARRCGSRRQTGAPAAGFGV